MEDYPRDLLELEARFSTDAACRESLFRLRWPDGFRCSRCGETKNWPKPVGLLRCADCGYQASVTAGTIFQDSRLPLTLWFRAAWWVTSIGNGDVITVLSTGPRTTLPDELGKASVSQRS